MKIIAALCLALFSVSALACNPHVCKQPPTICKYISTPYVCKK